MALHLIGYSAGILFHNGGACASVVAGRLTTATALVRNFANKMGLPRVYFDMTADNQPVGRIIMEVSGAFCFSATPRAFVC